ncbi:MAG: PASTA domain-containing protein, partial [bacterium]
GTEYELVVNADGTNTLKVLKGKVQVDTGSFLPTVALNPVENEMPQTGPMFMRAAFRPPQESSQQNQVEFVAVSGKVINLEREFVFANSCQRQHLFKISSPVNLNWFQFLGADQFAIDGKATRTIKFAVKLDGTNVPVGTQESQIVARCTDCTTEPGCGIGGLLLPITVKVIDNPSGSIVTEPRPTPPPLAESAVADRMQQITLPPDGRLLKSNASAQQIDQTLNWSNEVIIPGEPTYSAQSVVPRYRTWEERNQVFREARRSSVLNDDSRSKEMLADVYIDWGNGAKAEEELKGLAQATPERLTTLGEAYRLMGDLTTAERLLKQAISLDPAWAPALNALGNVYLDRAKAAQDQKDYVSARDYLQRAKQAYAQALAAQPAKSPDERNHPGRQQTAVSPGSTETVAHSNLGEVNLRMGEMANDEGKKEEAIQLYQLAEQEFGDAAKVDPTYQFAFTGLGDVYRETGETFGSLGDKPKADQYFARSQDHYTQAVRLHNDMAEAEVGLGKVLDDKGQHSEALRHYSKATRVRPDLAEPHYYFAVALAPFDPRLAAEQARAYLKVERQPFKQGEKAKNAVAVTEHRPVPIQTVTATITPTPPREIFPTPTPTPTLTPGKLVKIPGVKGDKPQSALNELTKLGLKGELRDQPDCDASGKVLYTEPAKDVKVPEGMQVTLFVSSLDPEAIAVPRVGGLSRFDAEDRLRGVGLRVKIRGTRETDERERDTVLDQSPAQGRPLMRGCEVGLTLAVPVPKVQVPNFVGLSRDQALRGLPRFFGELSRGSVIAVDSRRPPGTVVDQDPKAGTWVRRGTPVDLYISRFLPQDSGPGESGPREPGPRDPERRDPETSQVVVPDLFGMTQDQAKLAIRRMRGAVTLGNVNYENNTQFVNGTVMRQSPVAGRSVGYGTPIDLWIATSIGEEGAIRSIQFNIKHNSAGLRFGKSSKSRVVSVNRLGQITERRTRVIPEAISSRGRSL